MRSDFNTPNTRLQRATKKIQDHWLETKQTWDDRVSERFQERYLDPIVPQLQLVISAIHELTEIIAQAELATREEEPWH